MNLVRAYSKFAQEHDLAITYSINVENLLTTPRSILHTINTKDEVLVHGFIDYHELHASLRTIENIQISSSSLIRLSVMSIPINVASQLIFITNDLLDTFSSLVKTTRTGWNQINSSKGCAYFPVEEDSELIKTSLNYFDKYDYSIELIDGEQIAFRLPITNRAEVENMLTESRQLSQELESLFVSS